MTASVFTDPMRGAALLVSDDPIYALGPILVADDVEEAMEGMLAFIAALDQDPSQMPTIALMVEWQGFLGAITGTVVAVPLDAQEPPPGQVGGTDDETPAESEADRSEAQEAPQDDDEFDDDGRADERVEATGLEAGQPAAIIDDDDEEEDDDEDQAQELHERLAAIPGGTPRQRGKVECFACGGTGHALGQPDVTCNLCQGEGKIDEPEPVAATPTDEEQK